MIKAIYLDFDDTLYSHTLDKIPDSAVLGLNKAREKGIKIFICSGRSTKEMMWFNLGDLQLDGVIVNNGQVGLDSSMKKVLFSNPVEGELKKRCIELFNDKKYATYCATLDDIYLNFENEIVRKIQSRFSTPIPRVDIYRGEDIYMASAFFNNEEERKAIYDCFEEYAYITTWSEGAVDIVSKTVSKAKGIEQMNELFNIDTKETMAFGDGINDVDMLKHCNIGVGVGNGCEELKQSADYITDDIDNNGIYNALKHFNII